MRDIKFRGKQLYNGEMVYGDLIHGVNFKAGRLYILPVVNNLISIPGCDPLDGCQVDPESVGQFTGLKDKNGVDIYDGDILSDGRSFFRVEWGDVNGAWRLEAIKNIVEPRDEDSWIMLVIQSQQLGNGYYRRDDLEIIGNIWEHPHLLNP